MSDSDSAGTGRALSLKLIEDLRVEHRVLQNWLLRFRPGVLHLVSDCFFLVISSMPASPCVSSEKGTSVTLLVTVWESSVAKLVAQHFASTLRLLWHLQL